MSIRVMSVTKEAVLAALKQYQDPNLPGLNLVDRDAVSNIVIHNDNVSCDISWGYPAQSQKAIIDKALTELLLAIPNVASAVIHLQWAVTPSKTQNNMPSLHRVKNIIAVASGKGGVGKSTTSVNLALALAKEGAKVGLLDADIYGPSQPMMLGIPQEQRPEFVDEKFFNPIFVHGIQTMSMGYMITDATPMVWRGPMVSGALQQLLGQCLWHDLDYLIIDMPPGTGDIQLTLAQKVPVTGAVIVTTPQDIALLDAKKGIEMFRKVDIPILGVVENMATHICSSCGHEEHLFGDGGGKRIADEYQAELLGALPLDITIRQGTDAGKPTLITDPEGKIANIYSDIARKMAAALVMRGNNNANPVVQIIATDR